MSNKAKAHLNADGWLFYQCPGCDQHHGITTQSTNASGARWSFNGDLHHPTVSPSVHCLPYRNPKGQLLVRGCHHFIRDGQIQFLSDCDHDLAGKTVELPDWEE